MLAQFGRADDTPPRTGRRSHSQPPPGSAQSTSLLAFARHPIPDAQPSPWNNNPRPPLPPSRSKQRELSGSGVLAQLGPAYTQQFSPAHSARRRSNSAPREGTPVDDLTPTRRKILPLEDRMLHSRTELYQPDKDVDKDVQYIHDKCTRIKHSARYQHTQRYADTVGDVLAHQTTADFDRERRRREQDRWKRNKSIPDKPHCSKKIFTDQQRRTSTLLAASGGPATGNVELFGTLGQKKTHRFEKDSDPLLQRPPLPQKRSATPPTPMDREVSPVTFGGKKNRYTYSGGTESDDVAPPRGEGLRTTGYNRHGSFQDDVLSRPNSTAEMLGDKGIRKTHRFDGDHDPLNQRPPRPRKNQSMGTATTRASTPPRGRSPTPTKHLQQQRSDSKNGEMSPGGRKQNYTFSGGSESHEVGNGHALGLRTIGTKFSGFADSDPISHHRPPLAPENTPRGRSMNTPGSRRDHNMRKNEVIETKVSHRSHSAPIKHQSTSHHAKPQSTRTRSRSPAASGILPEEAPTPKWHDVASPGRPGRFTHRHCAKNRLQEKNNTPPQSPLVHPSPRHASHDPSPTRAFATSSPTLRLNVPRRD